MDILTKRAEQRLNCCTAQQRTFLCTIGLRRDSKGGKIKEYYAVRSVLCDRIVEGKYYSLQEVPGTKSTWTISKEEKEKKQTMIAGDEDNVLYLALTLKCVYGDNSLI